MTASETIGIGVIGAGLISAYHLAGLSAAGGAEVRVLAARTSARAGPMARRFGVPEVATDWRAVLERPDIDAVLIATPDSTHEEIAVAAARAGKAILLQKPMAMTVSQCRRIIAAAREAGVDLQVSWMHRHFEEVVRTQELLASDKLGPVHHVRIRNATAGPHEPWFFDRTQVAGGVVMQLGVHGIDLVRHLFGDIETLTASSATLQPERVFPSGERVASDLEDEALATYRLAGGVLGSHEMSFNEVAGTDRFRLEIYGADATLLLRTTRGPLAIFAPRLLGARGWLLPELPARPFGERQHARWLDILRKKIPSDRTAEDALAGQMVAEAIYRAADSRREEQVASTDEGA
jgi:myo-inositol 2-dehydrogenase/D-chiro-inositol 1-dehydrogenase